MACPMLLRSASSTPRRKTDRMSAASRPLAVGNHFRRFVGPSQCSIGQPSILQSAQYIPRAFPQKRAVRWRSLHQRQAPEADEIRPEGLRSNRLQQAEGRHPAGLIGRRIRPKASQAESPYRPGFKLTLKKSRIASYAGC